VTNEEKAKRRTAIEESNERTSTGRPMVYWVTRDSDAEGNLDPDIDVWLSQPRRSTLPGGLGAVWICDDIMVPSADGDVPARYATWTKDQCMRACNVIPETDRECVRVG
jgi:hypothetical protein